jgi:hypothetical protein
MRKWKTTLNGVRMLLNMMDWLQHTLTQDNTTRPTFYTKVWLSLKNLLAQLVVLDIDFLSDKSSTQYVLTCHILMASRALLGGRLVIPKSDVKVKVYPPCPLRVNVKQMSPNLLTQQGKVGYTRAQIAGSRRHLWLYENNFQWANKSLTNNKVDK